MEKANKDKKDEFTKNHPDVYRILGSNPQLLKKVDVQQKVDYKSWLSASKTGSEYNLANLYKKEIAARIGKYLLEQGIIQWDMALDSTIGEVTFKAQCYCVDLRSLKELTSGNVKRNCYYGVRVGDIVEYGTPGFPETYKTYKVVAYGFLDNNRVILQDEDCNQIKAVAEWCRIVKKVEDRT